MRPRAARTRRRDRGPTRRRRGADLAEVLPEHVQRPHPTTRPSISATTKSPDGLVVGDGLLVEQHAARGEGRDQRADRADVGGGRTATTTCGEIGWGAASSGATGPSVVRGGAAGPRSPPHHWARRAATAARATGDPTALPRPSASGGHGGGPPPQGWWRAARASPGGPCENQVWIRDPRGLGKGRSGFGQRVGEPRRPAGPGPAPGRPRGAPPGGRSPSWCADGIRRRGVGRLSPRPRRPAPRWPASAACPRR